MLIIYIYMYFCTSNINMFYNILTLTMDVWSSSYYSEIPNSIAHCPHFIIPFESRDFHVRFNPLYEEPGAGGERDKGGDQDQETGSTSSSGYGSHSTQKGEDDFLLLHWNRDE